MILVSRCLCGEQCKYNGGHNYREEVAKLCNQEAVVLACPEVLGGLPTPRIPAEIIGGSGEDVLAGKAYVVTKTGKDVTKAFIEGAYKALEIAQAHGATQAILKANSPSCGCGSIYDGTFKGMLIPGLGVTAALLKAHGIEVMTEEVFIAGMKGKND